MNSLEDRRMELRVVVRKDESWTSKDGIDMYVKDAREVVSGVSLHVWYSDSPPTEVVDNA